MQRKQQSLLSFFHNGAKKELPEDDTDSPANQKIFPHRNSSSSFDALKHKMFRPQHAPPSSTHPPPQHIEAFHGFSCANPSPNKQQCKAFFSANASPSKQQDASFLGFSYANASQSMHAPEDEAFHGFSPANTSHSKLQRPPSQNAIHSLTELAPSQRSEGFHGFSSTNACQKQTPPSHDTSSNKAPPQHNEVFYGLSPANALPNCTEDALKRLQKTVQAADERYTIFVLFNMAGP